jgi:hypothetical protein
MEEAVTQVYEEVRPALSTEALWFAFIGPLAAWKLQLMVNYILVPFACWNDLSLMIHLASAATLALALGAGWVAWRGWQELQERSRPVHDDLSAGALHGRIRFMIVSGLIFSAFASLLILAQWIPNLWLSPCWA